MTSTDLHCETCERSVTEAEASSSGTFGDLDADRWQTLCCPNCGARLRTVFVGPGDERGKESRTVGE